MCIHVFVCCVRMLLWDCDVYTCVCVLYQDAAVGL